VNFAETRFWLLLLGGLAVILLLRVGFRRLYPQAIQRFDQVSLLALGLLMLLRVSWVTLVIYVVVAVGTYAGICWILRRTPERRRMFLLVLIPLQLSPLFYYKYADFFCNRVFHFDFPELRGLLIPVGISFYTFQKVAFVIDTLAHNQPLPRFLDYLNFAGFFPQIVAGPIERRKDLLPQMEAFRFRWSRSNLDEGAAWIAVGLFFKTCLADNLATHFDASSARNPYLIWLANLVFGLRIYYDFAGYSLVAVGLGRCLGIKLSLNFLSPYCANTMTEFWRRWHVTLSQWFRDYVYVPLGGGRASWWALNIAVVFLVSGFWHGAGWNFILWGALHGIFLLVNRLWTQKCALPRAAAWLLTMVATFYAWLCFYETRTDVLLVKLNTLLSPAAYGSSALHGALTRLRGSDTFVLACLLTLAAGSLVLEWLSVARKNEPYYYLRRPLIVIALVASAILLAPGKNNAFIYFAF
jgi:alginate O-acetyltransferase complex protein AlgI